MLLFCHLGYVSMSKSLTHTHTVKNFINESSETTVIFQDDYPSDDTGGDFPPAPTAASHSLSLLMWFQVSHHKKSYNLTPPPSKKPKTKLLYLL